MPALYARVSGQAIQDKTVECDLGAMSAHAALLLYRTYQKRLPQAIERHSLSGVG